MNQEGYPLSTQKGQKEGRAQSVVIPLVRKGIPLRSMPYSQVGVPRSTRGDYAELNAISEQAKHSFCRNRTALL